MPAPLPRLDKILDVNVRPDVCPRRDGTFQAESAK